MFQFAHDFLYHTPTFVMSCFMVLAAVFVAAAVYNLWKLSR